MVITHRKDNFWSLIFPAGGSCFWSKKADCDLSVVASGVFWLLTRTNTYLWPSSRNKFLLQKIGPRHFFSHPCVFVSHTFFFFFLSSFFHRQTSVPSSLSVSRTPTQAVSLYSDLLLWDTRVGLVAGWLVGWTEKPFCAPAVWRIPLKYSFVNSWSLSVHIKQRAHREGTKQRRVQWEKQTQTRGKWDWDGDSAKYLCTKYILIYSLCFYGNGLEPTWVNRIINKVGKGVKNVYLFCRASVFIAVKQRKK